MKNSQHYWNFTMIFQIANTIGFDHLMKYYKKLFVIFYLMSHFPHSDHKLIQFTRVLKKWSFLMFLALLVSVLIILPVTYCHVRNQFDYITTDMVLVVNLTSVLIGTSPFLLYYDNFQKVWQAFKSIDNVIWNRLNFKMNYSEFIRTYLRIFSIYPIILTIYIAIRLILNTRLNYFRSTIFLVRAINLYFEFHAIFIINFFQFQLEMFGRFMHFAHQLNRSHLIFTNVNSVQDILKYYKEIHYQMWKGLCEVNIVLGASLVQCLIQSFFDVSSSIFFIFHYYKRENVFQFTYFLSNNSSFQFTSHLLFKLKCPEAKGAMLYGMSI